MRLDKFIAETLKVSRKDAKILIKKKLVKINGEIVKDDGYNVLLDKDIVTYLDQELKYEQYIYLLMHKPQGYVCALTNIYIVHILTLDLNK